MKLRYKNSKDFNEYSKKISDGLKKIPLRTLRLEMAKADNFTSVQAYCIALDNQVSEAEAHIDGTESSFNGKIIINEDTLFYVTHSFDVSDDLKLKGIDVWNNYIARLLVGSDFYHLVQSPSCELMSGGIYELSGYISFSDMEDEEKESLLNLLLTGTKPELSNYHAFTSHLLNSAEQYAFELLTDGETLYEDCVDEINDIYASAEVIDLMEISTPETMRSYYENNTQSEFANNLNFGLSDLKSVAMKDCYESLYKSVVNEFINAFLLELEEEELTIKRWEKINSYSSFEFNYIERAKMQIFEDIMRKIAMNKI